MRRVLTVVALAFVAGCASAAAPPGGPEDRLPPKVVRVTPDTNAVNVKDKVATFQFDEVINDRGTDAQEVRNFFLVSPSDGTPNVSWHRSRIDVRPRHGFRANTAYTISLLPGLGDLRGNTMKTGATLVFSTGPTIPTLKITGVAFDWAAGRVAPNALVEAITPDSIVYLAQADTGGRFNVGPLSPGNYLVRAIIDQNSNRQLDRGESWDTVRVSAPQAAPLELLTAARDTLAANVITVAALDSVTLRLTFDRLIDPQQTFPVSKFRLLATDSTVVPLVSSRTPVEEAALNKQKQQAALDSTRRADSLAGRLRAAPVPAPAPTAARAADSVRAGPATPSKPSPFTGITIIVGRPLPPNTNFLLRVTSVRALSGKVSNSERRFTTPRPAPPSDSTRARRAGAPGAAPNGAPTPAPAAQTPAIQTPGAGSVPNGARPPAVPPLTPPPSRP